MSYKIGEAVTWRWMSGLIEGVIEEVFLESVTREIKGKNITRHGTPEKPAYLVRSAAGNIALKLQSEISLAQEGAKVQKKKASRGPRLFGS